MTRKRTNGVARRSLLQGTASALGFSSLAAPQAPAQTTAQPPAGRLPGAKEIIRITRLETFLVKPRWLFLKVHTNAGLVGLGEPITEGRALTCARAVEELAPYLVGKDPRAVVHHWQAMYRHAFYRGGPILTSALSGVEQALWDLAGKSLGVPVYQMLGGPTRNRVRVYAHGGTPEALREGIKKGFTAFKTGPDGGRRARIIETRGYVDRVAARFARLREVAGPEVDIAIDFHGSIPPQTSKLLIKALEPYQPMFIEEPVNCQNHDVMADIA
ncbi:MAG: galactonate dehydratase, partial [Acidobacteria bacterium]|nr:galactonate dehydratase [Acidobacteriota bacterium]